MSYIEREAVNALIEAECSPKVAAFLNHAIDNIPAADVRPVRRGTWTDAAITADNMYDMHGMLCQIRGYICSCCHEFSLARFNFCPNCGADMREES